jgi:hypothetical protein
MALPMRSYHVGVHPSLHTAEDTTDMAQRTFQFFVTTEQPHQPEGAQRGLIRRLVMRNFFETKGSGIEKEGERSEMSSEATMKAKGRLKTRFRLGKTQQEKQKKEARTPKRRKGEGDAQEKRKPAMTRTHSASSESAQRGSKNAAQSHSPPTAESPEADADETKKKTGTTISNSPSAVRFDPFDVLPVPGTHQLDLLFRLREFMLLYFRFCFMHSSL